MIDLLYLSLLPIAVLLFALVCHLRRPGKVDMVDGEVVRSALVRRVQPGRFDPLRVNRKVRRPSARLEAASAGPVDEAAEFLYAEAERLGRSG
jgi:hypothetical protein